MIAGCIRCAHDRFKHGPKSDRKLLPPKDSWPGGSCTLLLCLPAGRSEGPACGSLGLRISCLAPGPPAQEARLAHQQHQQRQWKVVTRLQAAQQQQLLLQEQEQDVATSREQNASVVR